MTCAQLDDRLTELMEGTLPADVCEEVNRHLAECSNCQLPLAPLDFRVAFLVWNMLSLAALAWSLWRVAHHLAIPLTVWSVLPVVTLLVAKPRREAFGHARAPCIRTSVSDALHCVRARVSILVPGLK